MIIFMVFHLKKTIFNFWKRTFSQMILTPTLKAIATVTLLLHTKFKMYPNTSYIICPVMF